MNLTDKEIEVQCDVKGQSLVNCRAQMWLQVSLILNPMFFPVYWEDVLDYPRKII